MGYTMETTRIEKLYDELYEVFIYQGKISRFMCYVFELEKRLNFRPKKIDSDKNLEFLS